MENFRVRFMAKCLQYPEGAVTRITTLLLAMAAIFAAIPAWADEAAASAKQPVMAAG
jgi:hypothetical protein